MIRANITCLKIAVIVIGTHVSRGAATMPWET